MARLRALAAIYAKVGDADAALEVIEQLLEITGGFTVAFLETEFRFDSLRDHPRYRGLVERYR